MKKEPCRFETREYNCNYERILICSCCLIYLFGGVRLVNVASRRALIIAYLKLVLIRRLLPTIVLENS